MSKDDSETFAPGAFLVRQGEYGDCAYLILSGRVEVTRQEHGDKKRLGQVGPGAVVGEMALIDPAPRLASAVALEATTARKFTVQALEKAVDLSPPLARYLLQTFIRNIRVSTDAQAWNPSPANTLGAARFLPNFLSEITKNRILDRRSYGPGDVIFRQNQLGGNAYLVQSGTVSLVHEDANHLEHDLRRLGPGEVFGEMALLNENWPRFATAFTENGCAVEVISGSNFNQLLNAAPPIVKALLRIYVAMIRSLPLPAGHEKLPEMETPRF